MKRSVLVLNQDYRPLTICSLQKGFLLVYLDKAEIISEIEGKRLRTVSTSYPAPSVVRLGRYVNMPYKSVELSRVNIFKRDGYECQYCGENKDLTLDHLVPRSRNGRSTWKNLVTACKRCNARKGDYSPEEAGLLLKSKPFKPSFIMFLRDFSGFDYDEWKPYLVS